VAAIFKLFDASVDLQDVSKTVSCTGENKLLEALEEAQACLTPEEREFVELYYTWVMHGVGAELR
jgi:hypothetical protein